LAGVHRQPAAERFEDERKPDLNAPEAECAGHTVP
jgi:hypothetical protein